MSKFPEIRAVFDRNHEAPTTAPRIAIIQEGLLHLLPAPFFGEGATREERLSILDEELPIVWWTDLADGAVEASIYLLCRTRQSVARFFFEMACHWVLPGKQVEPSLQSALDFRMPELCSEMFTLAEIVLHIDHTSDVRLLRRNLPVIKSEMLIGVNSAAQAARILEVKGLTSDQKTVMIQESIGYLVRRRPKEFGADLFNEMQHFLVMCGDAFKQAHETKQMSRIICVHYYFRKMLRREVEASPDRRHLAVKLLKVRLHHASGCKRVLGVFVGLNLLSNNEIFEERHLLRAIRDHLPEAELVDDSFFASDTRGDGIRTLYMEVHKGDGRDFSSDEIRHLREGLPGELKGAVERQMHSVFVPRNEEETMRHILTLSQQLKYINDLPQVIISFHQQTDLDLIFNVVVLRVLGKGKVEIEELLNEAPTVFRHVIESQKVVGFIRKRYPKEASVILFHLPKKGFLRSDHSIDLYRARQAVVEELEGVVGEFRDFYGGMIAKQHELFDELREMVGPKSKRQEVVLENFFHSLSPGVMRTVLEAKPLSQLYEMLQEGMDRRGKEESECCLTIHEEERFMFVMIIAAESKAREAILQGIDALKIPSIELGSVELQVSDANCLGFVYRGDEPLLRRRLVGVVEDVLGAP